MHIHTDTHTHTEAAAALRVTHDGYHADWLTLTPSPAVITELDDIVLIAVLLGAHDEAEQSVFLLLSVNHHPASEEPVATVLTVGNIRGEIYFYKFQI